MIWDQSLLKQKYILEIVRKINADEIEFEVIDGCSTKISGNTAEFRINGMRANEYPAIDFSKPKRMLYNGRRYSSTYHFTNKLCDK